jgi:hypothetical protein
MEAEFIPDLDDIHRQVDHPRMFDESTKGLLYEKVFEFPKGEHESVVWGKYATELQTHKLGLKRIAMKQNPKNRYEGFISSTAGAVRSIQLPRGHGFSVSHRPLPNEVSHTGIEFKPAEGITLTRIEKNDLRMLLLRNFGGLVPCPKELRS